MRRRRPARTRAASLFLSSFLGGYQTDPSAVFYYLVRSGWKRDTFLSNISPKFWPYVDGIEDCKLQLLCSPRTLSSAKHGVEKFYGYIFL